MDEKLSDWEQLVKDVEEETRAAGPEAVAEMEALDAKYRRISERITRRREKKGLTQTRDDG